MLIIRSLNCIDAASGIVTLNCIDAASGIVTLSKWLSGEPDGHLLRMTIADAA